MAESQLTRTDSKTEAFNAVELLHSASFTEDTTERESSSRFGAVLSNIFRESGSNSGLTEDAIRNVEPNDSGDSNNAENSPETEESGPDADAMPTPPRTSRFSVFASRFRSGEFSRRQKSAASKKDEHLQRPLEQDSFAESSITKLTEDHESLASEVNFEIGQSEGVASVRIRKDETSKFVINPLSSGFRKNWDIGLALLIIWNAIYVPYRIAFYDDVSGEMEVVEYVLDAFFWADIVLNFFTGYTSKKGIIILSLPRVMKHYARSWFVVDLVATMPIDRIVAAEIDHSGGFADYLKLLKIVRLLKMLRILRLGRILGRLQTITAVKYTNMHIARFFMFVILVAHWIACIWFFAAKLNGDEDETWAASYHLFDQEVSSQYVMALFHSVMLMSTIGSHIQPVNDSERILAIFSMFLGASIFTYGVTNMTTLIFNANRYENEFRQKMDDLTSFFAKHHMPRGLSISIRDYYSYLHSKNVFSAEAHIMDDLNPSLRRRVLVYIYGRMVRKNTFFRDLESNMLSSVLLRLQLNHCTPGETIIREGDAGGEMFFIGSGIVQVVKDGQAVAQLEEGDFFGEVELLLPDSVRSATVRAVTFCEIFSLTLKDINALVKDSPDLLFRLHRIAIERLQNLKSMPAARPPSHRQKALDKNRIQLEQDLRRAREERVTQDGAESSSDPSSQSPRAARVGGSSIDQWLESSEQEPEAAIRVWTGGRHPSLSAPAGEPPSPSSSSQSRRSSLNDFAKATYRQLFAGASFTGSPKAGGPEPADSSTVAWPGEPTLGQGMRYQRRPSAGGESSNGAGAVEGEERGAGAARERVGPAQVAPEPAPAAGAPAAADAGPPPVRTRRRRDSESSRRSSRRKSLVDLVGDGLKQMLGIPKSPGSQESPAASEGGWSEAGPKPERRARRNSVEHADLNTYSQMLRRLSIGVDGAAGQRAKLDEARMRHQATLPPVSDSTIRRGSLTEGLPPGALEAAPRRKGGERRRRSSTGAMPSQMRPRKGSLSRISENSNSSLSRKRNASMGDIFQGMEVAAQLVGSPDPVDNPRPKLRVNTKPSSTPLTAIITDPESIHQPVPASGNGEAEAVSRESPPRPRRSSDMARDAHALQRLREQAQLLQPPGSSPADPAAFPLHGPTTPTRRRASIAAPGSASDRLGSGPPPSVQTEQAAGQTPTHPSKGPSGQTDMTIALLEQLLTRMKADHAGSDSR